MLLIGIDEAGYGPKLGPLCHGYCAIRCPDLPLSNPLSTGKNREAPPDLWRLLHPAVMRHPALEGSITVDDSKKVYSPAQGMDILARSITAFLECVEADDETESKAGLYERLLAASDRAKLEEDAWGAIQNLQSKIHNQALPSLKNALAKNGISVLALGARGLSPTRRAFKAGVAGGERLRRH